MRTLGLSDFTFAVGLPELGQPASATKANGDLFTLDAVADEHRAVIDKQLRALVEEVDHGAAVLPQELVSEGGLLHLVSPTVRGATLAELLAYLDGEPLPSNAIAYLVHQIAGAVSHAHAASDVDGDFMAVAHGRVISEMVHVSRDGIVQLRGFGFGAFLPQPPTPHLWMLAPEERKDGARVTPRGDVYSIAALAWCAWTGRAAPPGAEALDAKMMRGLQRDLLEPMGRALEHSLGKRRVTAMELEQAFGQFASGGQADIRTRMARVLRLMAEGEGPRAAVGTLRPEPVVAEAEPAKPRKRARMATLAWSETAVEAAVLDVVPAKPSPRDKPNAATVKKAAPKKPPPRASSRAKLPPRATPNKPLKLPPGATRPSAKPSAAKPTAQRGAKGGQFSRTLLGKPAPTLGLSESTHADAPPLPRTKPKSPFPLAENDLSDLAGEFDDAPVELKAKDAAPLPPPPAAIADNLDQVGFDVDDIDEDDVPTQALELSSLVGLQAALDSPLDEPAPNPTEAAKVPESPPPPQLPAPVPIPALDALVDDPDLTEREPILARRSADGVSTSVGDEAPEQPQPEDVGARRDAEPRVRRTDAEEPLSCLAALFIAFVAAVAVIGLGLFIMRRNANAPLPPKPAPTAKATTKATAKARPTASVAASATPGASASGSSSAASSAAASGSSVPEEANIQLNRSDGADLPMGRAYLTVKYEANPATKVFLRGIDKGPIGKRLEVSCTPGAYLTLGTVAGTWDLTFGVLSIPCQAHTIAVLTPTSTAANTKPAPK